jgi:hypothetical protein
VLLCHVQLVAILRYPGNPHTDKPENAWPSWEVS